jgi:hypothetical protein
MFQGVTRRFCFEPNLDESFRRLAFRRATAADVTLASDFNCPRSKINLFAKKPEIRVNRA